MLAHNGVRVIAAGLDLALSVEDRPIVVPRPADPGKGDAVPDLTPQVMLFSSGELTRFRLTLSRSVAGRSVVLTGSPAGKLEVGPIVEQAT